MRYAYFEDEAMEVSPPLGTESEARAWLAERLVGHLVRRHHMTAGAVAFREAVRLLVRDDGRAVVTCPFCDRWAGGTDGLDLPAGDSVRFLIIVQVGESRSTVLQTNSFMEAIRHAHHLFIQHLGKAHGLRPRDVRVNPPYDCQPCWMSGRGTFRVEMVTVEE